MNIKEAKEQIKNAIVAYFSKDDFGNYIIPIEKQRPIFLLGAPGIGKTAIMEQIAQDLDVGLVSYSMTHHTRQSALGLPFITKQEFDGKEYSVSEYTMSEIIAEVYRLRKETGYLEGILFLDEVNCVSETLAPAMLQFLQYKTFGTHRLPDGWIVVTAGNPPEYNRSVREYDIVTWDRLKRVDVEPDYGAWKEYAYQKGIHGAILTFLDIKKEYFYVVETSVDRKSFVTARGWEDLSQIMRIYEKKEIKIDFNLVSQYIQNLTIAKEFALYYDLYNKYRSDYQIYDILAGKAGNRIKERAEEARFDERLSLLGLLIDAADLEMRKDMQEDMAILETLKLLKPVKKKLSDPGASYVDILKDSISEARKRMEVGTRANSLDSDMRYAYNYAISFLEDMLGGCGDFDGIRESYDQTVKKHRISVEQTKKKLTNLFRFIEDVFDDGQEMLILVTELTVRYYPARFISKFGCDEYFKYNNNLMFSKRKKGLLSEIAEMTEEMWQENE